MSPGRLSLSPSPTTSRLSVELLKTAPAFTDVGAEAIIALANSRAERGPPAAVMPPAAEGPVGRETAAGGAVGGGPADVIACVWVPRPYAPVEP